MAEHDDARRPWRVRALRRFRGLDGLKALEPGQSDAAVNPDAPDMDSGGDGIVDAEVVEAEVEAEVVAPSSPVGAPSSPVGAPSAPQATPAASVAAMTENTRGPATADLGAQRRRARFRAVIKETYPSVADHVIALAEAGADADLDDWLVVARLLSDDLRHHSGGLTAQARQRALEQTVAAALEAQARSSARLAGYADDVHDEPSTFDGDPFGTLLWQHYVCPEARLALQSLHGEALGNWLDALNELWESAHEVYVASVARADAPTAHRPSTPSAPADPPSAAGAALPPVAALPAASTGAEVVPAVPEHRDPPPLDRPEQARVRLKAALVKVEELSLW